MPSNLLTLAVKTGLMTEKEATTSYLLQSVATGKIFKDTGWLLEAPGEEGPTLIRAIYEKEKITPGDPSSGFYRFADWLPVRRLLEGSSPPVTFKSNGLAARLGMENLFITFSGYWPEKGGHMSTCSFKETEAYSVCGRLEPGSGKVLVVASAGNTARAFARVCSDNKIPLLLCVPEDNIGALWFDRPVDDHVKLVVSRAGSDYFDAIHLSNIAASLDKFIPEGGAKNVARRDGMGTTVLSAVTTIGEIPEYYFQAVGSGTGAIAAWEANMRLIRDGRFGNRKMKLMISQNTPFTPIHDAWKVRSREILPMNDHQARRQVEMIMAKVLSNRKPPYGIAGGLFDALSDTGGEVLLAGNEEASAAAELFLITEGIDIHPAAAVATATLIRSIEEGTLAKDALVMLNVTGGGEARFMREHQLFFLTPSAVFDIDPSTEEVRQKLEGLF